METSIIICAASLAIIISSVSYCIVKWKKEVMKGRA